MPSPVFHVHACICIVQRRQKRINTEESMLHLEVPSNHHAKCLKFMNRSALSDPPLSPIVSALSRLMLCLYPTICHLPILKYMLHLPW